MDRRSTTTSFLISSILAAGFLAAMARDGAAADSAKIQEAIVKGQQFLLTQRNVGPNGTLGPYGAFAALALVKSGIEKNSQYVQQVVMEIDRKIVNGVYRPVQHFNYEAGIDLMILEAIDAVTYKPQMEPIVAFLVRTQHSNGSWYYDVVNDPDNGDTSITQYAILGLWAASRAGIDIPVDVWEKSARWHISKQRSDGGFAYHPFGNPTGNEANHILTSSTMTAAGTSSVLIIRRVLFGDTEHDFEVRQPEAKRRFGVLEKFVEQKTVKANRQPRITTMRVGEFDKTIREGIRWMSSHFSDKTPSVTSYYCYYFYCIERVAALTDVEKLGKHDWYDEGAEELLSRQAPNGSWTDSCQVTASTALALMFLSKATASVVPVKKQVSLSGGGLQIGGRGLPTKLDAIQIKDGNVTARKLVGPVDDMLIELERSADAKVEDVQAAVVEAVQLDRADELIGQTDRLQKLAKDPRVEVRRIAMWALGRSGDISTAMVLIDALSDPDPSVMREASLALCILSRRVDGSGNPVDPLDDIEMGLSEDSSDEARKAKLTSWSADVTKWWKDWYLKNRRYDECDDRMSLKRTNK